MTRRIDVSVFPKVLLSLHPDYVMTHNEFTLCAGPYVTVQALSGPEAR